MDFLFNNENIVADYRNENVLLFNDDCKNILSKINSESIDLFVSDIPYKISKKGTGIKKERNKVYGWYI